MLHRHVTTTAQQSGESAIDGPFVFLAFWKMNNFYVRNNTADCCYYRDDVRRNRLGLGGLISYTPGLTLQASAQRSACSVCTYIRGKGFRNGSIRAAAG